MPSLGEDPLRGADAGVGSVSMEASAVVDPAVAAVPTPAPVEVVATPVIADDDEVDVGGVEVVTDEGAGATAFTALGGGVNPWCSSS